MKVIDAFENFKENGGFCLVLGFKDSETEDIDFEWQLSNMTHEAAIAYLEVVKLNLVRHLEKLGKWGK